MLVNTRKQNDSEGFNPNVDNGVLEAIPSSGQKIGYNFLLILSWILILPGIIWLFVRISKKNQWIKDQMSINNAASAIDVNLTKRAETLIKLLEQTKGYLKHERDTLINITQARSSKNASINEVKEFDKTLNDISKNIQLTFENYPNLKGSSVVGELMSSSQYIESEIAASRRLYNQYVQRFNADIFIFPNICFAYKNKMQTFPLFSANDTQKKDVDMSSLSTF